MDDRAWPLPLPLPGQTGGPGTVCAIGRRLRHLRAGTQEPQELPFPRAHLLQDSQLLPEQLDAHQDHQALCRPLPSGGCTPVPSCTLLRHARAPSFSCPLYCGVLFFFPSSVGCGAGAAACKEAHRAADQLDPQHPSHVPPLRVHPNRPLGHPRSHAYHPGSPHTLHSIWDRACADARMVHGRARA